MFDDGVSLMSAGLAHGKLSVPRLGQAQRKHLELLVRPLPLAETKLHPALDMKI